MKLYEWMKNFANSYFMKNDLEIGKTSELIVDLINATKNSGITIKELYEKYWEKIDYQQWHRNRGSDVIAINKKMEFRVISFQDGDSTNIDLLNELSQKRVVALDQDGQLIGIYKNPYTRNQERKLYSSELIRNIIENWKPQEDRERHITENTELLIRLRKWCSDWKKVENFLEQTEVAQHLRAHIDILMQKEIASATPESDPKWCLVILKDEQNANGLKDAIYRVNAFRKDRDLGMMIQISRDNIVRSKDLYFFRYRDIRLYLEWVKSSSNVSAK